MGIAIGALSGKGGVGKTTVVANMGIILTRTFKKNVIIVDSNITTSHLGLHFGLYNDLPVTLKDILSKRIPISYAIFIHPETGIRILPAPLSGGNVKFTKLNKIIKQLKKDYEIVILDCAPGLGREAVSAAKSIDEAFVVTTPELPAITDALKTINLLEKLNKKILGIVLNRVKKEKYELTINEIESTCNHKVIAVIPEDDKVPESIANGKPIVLSHPNSAASVNIKRFAASLIGEEYIQKGFWYSLKKMLGLIKSKRKEIVLEVLDIEKLKKGLTEEIKEKKRKEKKS